MPPEACSGAGAAAPATARDELGPDAARARAVEVDEVDARARPPRRSARASATGLAGALDDLVVVALVEPDGLLAEDVDGRDHLDRLLEPHRSMHHVNVLT